jgi:tellurite resistance protein TehA-like permease
MTSSPMTPLHWIGFAVYLTFLISLGYSMTERKGHQKAANIAILSFMLMLIIGLIQGCSSSRSRDPDDPRNDDDGGYGPHR